MTFLLIANFQDFLIHFRCSLLGALLERGLTDGSPVRQQLVAKGLYLHNISLRRTGMNPLIDLVSLFHLWRLMRSVRPDFVLSYTKQIYYLKIRHIDNA